MAILCLALWASDPSAASADAFLPIAGAVEHSAGVDALRVPMQPLVAAIAGWIAADLGLPMPASLPRTDFAHPHEMAAIRRGPEGGAPGAAPIALYDSALHVIYLPHGWSGGTPAELSMLVHEMVHHLQALSGKRFSCAGEREAEAFASQERWLAMFGGDLERDLGIEPLFLLLATLCGPY